MHSTVARRLSTLASFYKYCEQEQLVDRNPSRHVRRPKVDYESRTLGLERNASGAFLVSPAPPADRHGRRYPCAGNARSGRFPGAPGSRPKREPSRVQAVRLPRSIAEALQLPRPDPERATQTR